MSATTTYGVMTMNTDNSLHDIDPAEWPADWQPLDDDGLLVEPCGCTYLVIPEGEAVPELFCSEECEDAWEAEGDSLSLGWEFDRLVYEALMLELERFRPMSEIHAAATMTKRGPSEDIVEESHHIYRYLADGMGCMPWFMWMAEYADATGDLRLPWPVIVDAVIARNEYMSVLRPDGLQLVDNVEASTIVYFQALLESRRAETE